ncbi:MAG TPA: hypothetical protein DCL08_03980, partial [Anaerolineaceae bacterium]|nr:hypothetical protein [Anaerolineaceae bacterium]
MPEQYDNIPGIWYRIDFHVHTPASHDFKKTSLKIDDAYREFLDHILEIKSDLDVIVITDHNNVDGYDYILKMEKKALQTQDFFNDNTWAIPDDAKKIIDLFNESTEKT